MTKIIDGKKISQKLKDNLKIEIEEIKNTFKRVPGLAVVQVGDVAAKLASFGWVVKEIDGHSMIDILEALEWASKHDTGPAAIVANTVKGKGVSFMEDNPSFHGMAPNDEQLDLALEELS